MGEAWPLLQIVQLGACIAIVVLAAHLVLKHTCTSRARLIVVLCSAGVGAAILGSTWSWRTTERAESTARLVSEIPQTLRAGPLDDVAYVSSVKCQSCHPREYGSWHDSYHRTMTQSATSDVVIGDFDDVRLTNRGRTYQLQRDGDEFWVEMIDPDWEADMLARGNNPDTAIDPVRSRKRVVMTTGSHRMQTYWTASETDGRLYNLPFAWLNDLERWVPREDVFLRPPQAQRAFSTWHDNCIECHATAGEGNHDPDTGTWDPEAAELGIACEACHGPAEAHVRKYLDPLERWQARQSEAPDDTIVNPARLSAPASAQVCGQCHGMNLFRNEVLKEGQRYRPGDDLLDTRMILRTRKNRLSERELAEWDRLQKHIDTQEDRYLDDRFWPDGMVRVSGRDHNALIESACFEGGELSCLNCHAMHDYESNRHQIAPGALTNAPCLECHEAATYDASSHTHHSRDVAGGAGTSCYDCHMPHTVYGLMSAIRSHEIDSPSVRVNLESGRPNACNLCHLDKSLGWTADLLTEWYGQERPSHLSRDEETVGLGPLYALTGNANQRALVAWHMGWEPARAASGEDWLGLYLSNLLGDPYSCVRFIAERSLRRDPAYADFEYDYVASASAVSDQRDQALRIWIVASRGRRLSRTGPAVLIGDDGAIDADRLSALSSRRDDRDMDLRE